MMPRMQIETADQVWSRIAERASAGEGSGVVASDGDGTLWSGDVGEDLFHALAERGAFREAGLEAMRREARDHALSDAGTGPDVAHRIYAAYVEGRFPEETVCELMAWCFAGWTRADVASFAEETVARIGLEGRMHREVLSVLEKARRAGLEAVLVSASPFAVVKAAGALAGFDAAHIVAARPRFEAEVMLADVERPIPYGVGKVSRLREHMGQGRTLLAAFGDNAFDVDLLASAAVGVAVCPKPRLRERAGQVPGLVELLVQRH
jgi:phosphatidylglycerophosphatase C